MKDVWGKSFIDVSPQCPWCGDEISDDPWQDFPANGEQVVECGNCGKQVEINGHTSMSWKARKVTFDD